MTDFYFDETELDAHEAIETAVEAVKRQTFLEGDETELDQDDLAQVSDHVVNQTLSSASANESRDVFDDVYNLLKPKLGQAISCRIYRNSELIGSVESNAFSWEELIEDFGTRFGAGLYKVTIRKNGKFAGQQEQQLNVKKVENKEPIFNPLDFLKEMKSIQDVNDSRQAEKEEAMKNDNANVMKTMMEGMQTMMLANMQKPAPVQNNEPNMATMMLEMQKMNMSMIEKLSSDQKDMMREMRSEFKDTLRGLETQIANNANNSKDSGAFDPLSFFQIMKENENSAVDNLLRMQEIAKASAVVSEPVAESMTDKALKMLPAILGTMNNNKAPDSAQQTRRALPRQRNNPTRVKSSAPRSSTVRQESPRIITEKQVSNSTITPQDVNVEAKVENVAIETTPVIDQPVVETAQVENSPIPVTIDEDTAVALNEAVIPIVLNGLMEESEATETVYLIMGALKGRFSDEIINNIAEIYSLENIMSLIEQTGIMELAVSQGRSEELKIWLGDLHYALKSKTKTNDEELAESDEL